MRKRLIAGAGILLLFLAAIGALYAWKRAGRNMEENVSSSLDKPYGVKISNITDEGIQVYWKNTEYAKGYEVFRSYSKDGGYERIAAGSDFADPTEPSHSTCTDAEFDRDKRKVYYKVRSYEFDEQDRKIYSNFSKVMTAKFIETLKLGCQELYLPAGMSRTIQASYGWGDLADAEWISDDESVAVVDDSGRITASGKGSCSITCRSESLDQEQQCTVTVNRDPLPPLEKITSRYARTAPGIWENPDASDSGSAVITMTGDMMCTSAQQRVMDGGTGDYNFNESFSLVKDIISGGDFSIGNLETLLSSSWPYMCEEVYIDNAPNCNAPSRYLDALKFAGFDGLVMSNNHNCDGGEAGAVESSEIVDAYQFANTGLFTSEEDVRTLLVDVNGIKVGFLSYTPAQPGFNGKDKDWPRESIDTLLNYYEKDKAEADMRELRSKGAEYVIVYIHWGAKNEFGIGNDQKQAARELADMGADYIVGGHSHLVQVYDEITSADGKAVPCFYSLGDFNSSINQIAGNRDSVILRIRLEKNEDGKIELAENGYIPCYTYTEYEDMKYVTVPLNQELNGNAEVKNYEKFRKRIAGEVGDKLPEYRPAA